MHKLESCYLDNRYKLLFLIDYRLQTLFIRLLFRTMRKITSPYKYIFLRIILVEVEQYQGLLNTIGQIDIEIDEGVSMGYD